MAGPNRSITSYEHGVMNTSATDGIDPPLMLSERPFVSNGIGGNKARASGWDTLSGGVCPHHTADAIIGVQDFGSHNYTVPGLSGVALLWNATIGPQSGGGAQGLVHASVGTRKITLSSTGASHVVSDLMPENTGIDTTFVTWISGEIECAVLYKNGKSSMYTVSADSRMADTLPVSGQSYNNYKNVGPNIRRLVALGYR